RRRDPELPEPDALGQIGHAQPVSAVLREHGAHLGGAEPVAPGLDDREDLALRANELTDGAHVVRRGGEIDLEQGRARREPTHRRPRAASRSRPRAGGGGAPGAAASGSQRGWRRPASLAARSGGSMTLWRRRSPPPAANAALAQCMTALMLCLCAA